MLDPDLITDYYKSLMINYENAMDDEIKKLKDIKKRYVCYKCGNDNALDRESFRVDIKEKKIICNSCCDENHIKYFEVNW